MRVCFILVIKLFLITWTIEIDYFSDIYVIISELTKKKLFLISHKVKINLWSFFEIVKIFSFFLY